MIRPDFIFSNWIFVWFLLYKFGVRLSNPKFALIIALIENIIIFALMMYFKTNIKKKIMFIIMVLILKIIPLYFIWNTKIKRKDIIASLVLFIIYLIWLFVLNNKKINYLIKFVKNLIRNDANTPGIALLNKLLFIPLTMNQENN
jgi:hypothetical protein